MFITLYTVYMHICTDIGNLNEGWRNNSVSKSPIFFSIIHGSVKSFQSNNSLPRNLCDNYLKQVFLGPFLLSNF